MKKTSIIIALVIALFTAVVCDRHIRARAADQSSMFISIDWLIRREIHETGESPESIDKIITESYSSQYYNIFPDGLIYSKKGSNSYTLEQHVPQFIRLYDRDRLVSSETLEPRYEHGEKVTKF
jgi:hypothetical protein